MIGKVLEEYNNKSDYQICLYIKTLMKVIYHNKLQNLKNNAATSGTTIVSDDTSADSRPIGSDSVPESTATPRSLQYR